MWNITIQTEDGPVGIERSLEEFPTRMELELALRMEYGKYTKFTIIEQPSLIAFVPGKTTRHSYRDLEGNIIPTSKYYHHSFATEESNSSVDDDDLFFEELYQ